MGTEAGIKMGGPRCRDARDLDREGEMGTRGGDEDRWRHRDIGVTETERWGERADDRERGPDADEDMQGRAGDTGSDAASQQGRRSHGRKRAWGRVAAHADRQRGAPAAP